MADPPITLTKIYFFPIVITFAKISLHLYNFWRYRPQCENHKHHNIPLTASFPEEGLKQQENETETLINKYTYEPATLKVYRVAPASRAFLNETLQKSWPQPQFMGY